MGKVFKYMAAVAIIISGLLAGSTSAVAQNDLAYASVAEAARNAGIDAARVEAVVQRAMERGITPEQLGSLMEPVITLAGNNLPAEPVLQKVLEGIAKRVPAPQIGMVIGQIESALNRSAGIVDGWLEQPATRDMVRAGTRGQDAQQATSRFRTQLLEGSAQALQQNIREEYLSDLLGQIATERAAERSGLTSVAAAVGILGDLPTTQNNPELSTRVVISALRSGFTPSEIQQLPAAMNAAELQSRLPAEAVANGMAEQVLSGLPAAQVLENLFKGNLKGGPPGFTPPGLINRPDRNGQGNNRRPTTPPGRPGN
jgi:hypothetical protein